MINKIFLSLLLIVFYTLSPATMGGTEWVTYSSAEAGTVEDNVAPEISTLVASVPQGHSGEYHNSENVITAIVTDDDILDANNFTLVGEKTGLVTESVPSSADGGKTIKVIYTVTKNDTYKFTAKDKAGAITDQTVKVEKIDDKKPTITLTEQTDYNNKESTVSITVTDNESGLKKEDIKIDGMNLDLSNLTPNEGKTIKGTFTVTESGSYTVTASDKAENPITEQIIVKKIDKQAPTITLKDEMTIDKSKVTVLIKIDDDDNDEIVGNESGVNPSFTKIIRDVNTTDKEILKAYFENNSNGVEPLTTNLIEIDQNVTYAIYAKDNAGNSGVEVKTVTGLDKTPPTITKGSITTNLNKTVATVNVSIETGVVLQKWSLGKKDKEFFRLEGNGKEFTGSSFSVEENGTYSVYAKDAAGNESVIDDIKVDSIDKTPPAITLTQSKLNQITKRVTIIAKFTDATEGYKWALDSEPHDFKSITPIDEAGILTARVQVSENGNYIFCATDQAGNEGCGKIEVKTIDLDGPVINLIKQTGYSNKENGFKITVEAYDQANNGVTNIRFATGKKSKEYFTEMDSETPPAPKNVSTPIVDNEFLIYENGDYTVYAEDSLGNGSVKSITVSEILDGAPKLTLSEQSNFSNSIVTVTVEVEANASGIATQRYATGVKTVNDFPSSGTTFIGTSFKVDKNGQYTVYVKDNAGFETVEIITVTMIDKKAPEIELNEIKQFHNVSLPIKLTFNDDYLESVTEIIDGSENTRKIVGSGIAITKWAKGKHEDVTYFETNGTDLTIDSSGVGTFNVTENGIYTVYAEDAVGNSAVKEVKVENIDKIAPQVSLSLDKVSGEITMVTSDMFPGIKEIALPNGDKVKIESIKDEITEEIEKTVTIFDKDGNELSPDVDGKLKLSNSNNLGYSIKAETLTLVYKISNNGDYKFTAFDAAGNKTDKTIKVTTIDLEGPMISVVENDQYSKDRAVVRFKVYDESSISEVKWARGKQDISYFRDNKGEQLGSSFGNSVELSFLAEDNDVYTIYASDKLHNPELCKEQKVCTDSIKIINVQNIDNDTPDFEDSEVRFMGEDRVILINVSDAKSGISHVVLPDGSTTTDTSIVYNVTKNPTKDKENIYKFVAYDRVGNKKEEYVKVLQMPMSLEKLEEEVNQLDKMDPQFTTLFKQIQENYEKLRAEEKEYFFYQEKYDELKNAYNDYLTFDKQRKESNYDRKDRILRDSDVKKEWKITFSTNPANTFANRQLIKVKDKFGDEHPTTVTIKDNTITVKPREENYIKGNTYHLIIESTLVDEDGRDIVNGVWQQFKIE